MAGEALIAMALSSLSHLTRLYGAKTLTRSRIKVPNLSQRVSIRINSNREINDHFTLYENINGIHPTKAHRFH